jgi:hypothetical protein
MAVVTDIFPNFASALAACGQGYNDGEIADALSTSLAVDRRQFTPEQAINSILAAGVAAAETTGRPLTVLDFGGGCGFHSFRVISAIRMPLRWAVVETSIMAERAAKLAQDRSEVFTTLAEAVAVLGGEDLIHASSAIQYVLDPLVTLTVSCGFTAMAFCSGPPPGLGHGVQTWPLSAPASVRCRSLLGNRIGEKAQVLRRRRFSAVAATIKSANV